MKKNQLGRALADSKRATAMLYKPVAPLMTNMWAIMKTRLVGEFYIPIRSKRSPVIYDALTKYTMSLDVRSVDYFAEIDYFDKYYVARNFYLPESLAQQAYVDKWFLGGSEVSPEVRGYLNEFWEKFVPANYQVKSPEEISCPKWDATSGVALIHEEGASEPHWVYAKKGPYWSGFQRGTETWLQWVHDAVPDEWLLKPLDSLIGVRSPELENLSLERPVIRSESGPGKVRWARASSANLYILGRMFMDVVQSNDTWSGDPTYIGKSTNTQFAAIRAVSGERVYVGTHGDDFIIYCPICEVWHSGDWSNFDLHVAARQQLASYQAMYNQIQHLLTRRQQKLFYALAYFTIRCRTLWLWDRDGRPKLSIRSTLGKVRSGSGDFVMHNNAMNKSIVEWLFEQVHNRIAKKGRSKPCKSKLFWKEFQILAKKHFGWIAKPSAQLTHPHGFIACRAVHTREDGFTPRPTVSSVVRNWVNPAYDPQEGTNGSQYIMTARFRDLNSTLAWARDCVRDDMMDTLVDVAVDAGVEDPYGLHLNPTLLGRAIQKVVDQYNMSSYLNS